MLPTRNANTCFNLFYSGKTDLILDTSSIPSTCCTTCATSPTYHPNPFGATTFIRFNVKRKPFDDVRVRQALALALDKQDIVDKITRAGEPVANTLVPPGNAGYVPPRGLVRNRRRSAETSRRGRLSRRPGLSRRQSALRHKGTVRPVATEMQALWERELGITSIHLRGEEWKVYLNTQASVDFDLCLSRWVGDYGDPQTFIDMFVTDGGNNDTELGQPALRPDARAIREHARSRQAHAASSTTWKKSWSRTTCPSSRSPSWSAPCSTVPDKLGGFEPNFVDDHRWGDFYIPGKK